MHEAHIEEEILRVVTLPLLLTTYIHPISYTVIPAAHEVSNPQGLDVRMSDPHQMISNA